MSQVLRFELQGVKDVFEAKPEFAKVFKDVVCSDSEPQYYIDEVIYQLGRLSGRRVSWLKDNLSIILAL